MVVGQCAVRDVHRVTQNSQVKWAGKSRGQLAQVTQLLVCIGHLESARADSCREIFTAYVFFVFPAQPL